MAKIENEQLDIKVDKGTERAREKVFTSKDLGCHIKFQVKNVVCTMVLALGFFLVVTQHLLPLSGFDTKKIWCTETAKLDCVQQADIQPKQYDLLSQELLHEKVNKSLINLNNGVVQVFKPHGLATHLYIEMSAYRGGPRVFSIVGLTSKPTETYHKPPFACEWVSHSTVVKGLARKNLPDWNYGRLYTVVVITCTFAEDVGVRGEGGELILYASYGDQFRQPERIVALVESKGEYNASIFNPRIFLTIMYTVDRQSLGISALREYGNGWLIMPNSLVRSHILSFMMLVAITATYERCLSRGSSKEEHPCITSDSKRFTTGTTITNFWW